ncbi:hypothetical protein FHR85_001938 [Alkalibacillus almallahensis]|nr:hypothetical protein [Alkalibacillus almallahensis]
MFGATITKFGASRHDFESRLSKSEASYLKIDATPMLFDASNQDFDAMCTKTNGTTINNHAICK